jgi:hypothetical protein
MESEIEYIDRIRHPNPKKSLKNTTLLLVQPKYYPKCFIGCKAVDWILKNQNFIFKEWENDDYYFKPNFNLRIFSENFLKILINCNLIHHVDYSTNNIDSFNLFKFSVFFFFFFFLFLFFFFKKRNMKKLKF